MSAREPHYDDSKVPEGRLERVIVLAVAGLLAFNYPLLSLFSVPVRWLGIPLLYLYLFTVWCVFIGLVAWFLERRGGDGPDAEPRDRGG